MIAIPTYENVHSFGALLAAFRKARRAKRGRGDEPVFYLELESNLLALSDALRTRSFVPDAYRYFSLHNRKDRVVSVASFRDRVVHHSLVAELEPFYESRFIPTSFACRKNKGMHRALKLAHVLSRQHRYFLKLDIRKYFDHISHPILLDTLALDVSDDGILWLSRTLLDNARVPDVAPSEHRGVPIGNLTSQFWANVYLNRLDHAVAAAFSGLAYLRYMDDILVFGANTAVLWPVERFASRYVAQELNLEMKDKATVVAPISEGIPWLGFRMFPALVRLDHESKARFLRKMTANADRAIRYGETDSVVSSAASLCGHVMHCNSLRLRQRHFGQVDDV